MNISKKSFLFSFLISLLIISPSFLEGKAKNEIAVLKGYVFLWSQDCSQKPCALPKPLKLNMPLTSSLKIPEVCGGADMSREKKDFPFEGGKIKSEFSFFALYPCDEDIFYQI
ncbi:MAG: hypothetical protein U9Q34_04145 [Elusimicrobiota bacterium]|nr:hypothetical protein [Elusimicrobiota bacterium]